MQITHLKGHLPLSRKTAPTCNFTRGIVPNIQEGRSQWHHQEVESIWTWITKSFTDNALEQSEDSESSRLSSWDDDESQNSLHGSYYIICAILETFSLPIYLRGKLNNRINWFWKTYKHLLYSCDDRKGIHKNLWAFFTFI